MSDEIVVDFKDCPGFLPNVITPNGDGYNDRLVFENIDLRSWSLRVVNRWGEEVYYSKAYHNQWDGSGINDGLYYYHLFSSELNKHVRGWVHVMR